ncbi:hypothetical protein HYU07_00215 [Candidatus Woesearchaeota archaeon]|nr:hypothetical protein [Candidatus Woesearchaeota archaeon]
MKNKKIKLAVFVIFAAAFITLLATFTFPQAQQCCYNPNAGSRICTDSALANCCPTPEASYSDYYSAATGYGPQDYANCNANYYSGTQGCSAISKCTNVGCCCPGGTSYVIESECPTTSTSTFTAYNGRTCTDVCATTPPPPPPTGACNDVTYKQPPNATTTYPKGELGVQLNFYASCTVSQYIISKCITGNCASYTQIATTLNNFYIDGDVLWDTNYTYKIVAEYSLSGASDPRYLNTTTGNVECWNKLSSDKFCLHNSSYLEFKTYLTDKKGFSADENAFLLNAKTSYGSRFNKAYTCNDNNKLVGPDPSCSSTYADICAAEGATAQCLKAGACSNASANPYGIFFSKSLCEGAVSPKYCFYDRSPSITNYCYECSPSMLCYDYRSESACSSNNCNVGNCKWIPTIAELGIGVCADLDRSNCELCNLKGTSSASNLQSYNEIFDICTLGKATALSTANYPCYVNGTAAISCNAMTCVNYTQTECGTQHITLDSNNRITTSGADSCKIGVCEYINGKCHKNTDNNNAQDCADGNNSCEADYFNPTTTIVPVKATDNSYEYLDIQIYDKTSKSDYGRSVLAPGSYRTYLCHYGPGEAECGAAGHPYSNSTTQLKLYVNDYTVSIYDGAIQTFLFNLTSDNDPATSDNNIIKYYTEDPSHNLGIVQSVLITPVPTPPHILNIIITEGTEVNDVIYTKNALPTITVIFDEPATIILSKINSSTADITFSTNSSGDRKTYTFIPTAALGQGSYTFSVRAKDDLETLMPTVFAKAFVVDTTPPTVTLQSPKDGNYSLEATMAIIFNFSEKVFLDDVTVNGASLNISTFSSSSNKLFTKSQQFLDGSKTLVITAHDYAGNTVSSRTLFEIDAIPLVITMIQPPYNVSSTQRFNITLLTDKAVQCRQTLDISVQSFSNMAGFDSSNSTAHQLYNIYLADENNHNFYVRCNDTIRGLVNVTFIIRVDSSPPQIITAYANPSPVVEFPPNVTLNVQTNEATLCKYSNTTQNYALMEGNFSSYAQKQFNTIHRQIFYLPLEERSYTYYVACENLAGWASATSAINFAVNLSAPITIAVYTLAYSNMNQTKIDIGTNKNAECFWGISSSSMIYLFSETTGYRHKHTPGQQEGSNTYYAKCIAAGLWSDPVTITFLVDTKKPNMSYVDDSSNLANNTQYSYFSDRLQAKWHGTDAGSGIWYYQYLLEDSYLNVVVNWTTSSIDDQWYWLTKDNEPNWMQSNGTKLNLTNLRTYKFKVKAVDYANWTSDVMSSDGVTVDISKLPGHCIDLLFESDTETDVDCGKQCAGCISGKNCLINSDCLSGYCPNSTKKCANPSCNDDIRNGDETDIDCGGSCSDCPEGKKCIQDNDCATNLKCKSGICKKNIDSCKDAKLSGDETDIDCGGGCDPCSPDKNCLSNSDCKTNYCSPNKKCINQTCSDNVKNNDETDKDCGGSNCPKCHVGKTCLISRDCATNYCLNSQCTEKTTGSTTEPNPEKSGGFNWFPILLAVLIIAALGGGGYAFYEYYYKPYLQKKKPHYSPRMQQPITLSRPEAKPGFMQRPAHRSMEIKRAAEKKEREKVFNAFEEENTPEKIAEKPTEAKTEEKQVEQIDVAEENPGITKIKPEVKGDIFAKLRILAEKPKKEIKTKEKPAALKKETDKDEAFKRLKGVIKNNLKGDYAKKLIALAESRKIAKQDLSRTFSNLLKTKKITRGLAEEILSQLIKLDKIAKSDARSLLLNLADQKLITAAQAKKILSNLDAE